MRPCVLALFTQLKEPFSKGNVNKVMNLYYSIRLVSDRLGSNEMAVQSLYKWINYRVG